MIIEVHDLNRPKAKYRFNMVSMFLYYIIQNAVITEYGEKGKWVDGPKFTEHIISQFRY